MRRSKIMPNGCDALMESALTEWERGVVFALANIDLADGVGVRNEPGVLREPGLIVVSAPLRPKPVEAIRRVTYRCVRGRSAALLSG